MTVSIGRGVSTNDLGGLYTYLKKIMPPKVTALSTSDQIPIRPNRWIGLCAYFW